MNDSIRVMRRPRRAWPSASRTAAALALLAAACSGSPSSTGPGSSSDAGGSANSPSAIAYSQCMRSHGVPNFPDPTVDSEGRPGFNLVPIHGTDWNSPQVSTDMQGCEHMMPGGVPVPVIAPGGPG